MDAVRIIAIVLIISGLWSLVDGSFSYTRETHKTRESKSGSLEVSVKEIQTVYIPDWAGIGAIIAGSLLLNRKRAGGDN